NFFGALPDFQVASGGSTTEYHGVKLTRTLVQCGDYFLDLFDAESPDVHTYDLPLHGFGRLALEGLNLERQPVDLFGNKPGIPGYDQLTDIDEASTDSSFEGIFTDKGEHLMVRVIGERGTDVIKASTPPIGGFYKQSAPDNAPFPLLMTRRVGKQTTFVSLIHAYGASPVVTSFTAGPEPGSYVVYRGADRDLVSADVHWALRSMLPSYSIVREVKGSAVLAAGFNVEKIMDGPSALVDCPVPLGYIQCKWNGNALDVIVDESEQNFVYAYPRDLPPVMNVYAPRAESVTVNGARARYTRDGDHLLLHFPSRVKLSLSNPANVDGEGGAIVTIDSALIAGEKNTLYVDVLNGGDTPVTGTLRFSLAPDWKEQVQSQLGWWGGIVNLVPTNKGPLERRSLVSPQCNDGLWAEHLTPVAATVQAKRDSQFTLLVDVPPGVPPAMYRAAISFGTDTLWKNFIVRPPVSASLLLSDGQGERLNVAVTNLTGNQVEVSAALKPDPAWKPAYVPARGAGRRPSGNGPDFPAMTMSLAPYETRRVDIPVRFSGYTKENQLYPIALQVKSGSYAAAVTHDFYVGVAHGAKNPPSLDGSWTGWNRADPMTIDSPSQIGRLLFGNQAWHGVKDLSADIYAMYDRTYLYIGAAVTDDSVVAHWDFPRMGYPWDADCMEVVIDARDNSLQGHDPPTPGTYRHLCLPEYRQTDFSSIAWQGASAPDLVKPNLVPGGETFFHRTKNGYAIIARLPLAGMPGVVAKPGSKIGFDVAFNDNDGTSFRKNQHIWAGYLQNQSWWDIGTIGALIFAP
ncbi:MAG TPA: sugar-binding protein, partial [Bacteroidota bacterium]|nr:sugar-binding protein [Bacteroidota bacterium]